MHLLMLFKKLIIQRQPEQLSRAAWKGRGLERGSSTFAAAASFGQVHGGHKTRVSERNT